ncbi:hypothetical protein QCE73_14945 [Caballeronia sp. LZ029]|uniref:hypothetical protein n=1 Tax=Caballeronia sp. LZ029 TaxID=3038564 RepID=UPI0028659185|nr:hypothetical protein [Caballeronia sp. LZ029]MDR5744452.1 hypothetical protein [Caballeronia sp. LZ029]
MKKISTLVLLTIAILLGTWAAVQSSNGQRISKHSEYMLSPRKLIRLGNPQLSDLNGPGSSVENHPSGTTFYQHNWTRGNLGTVEFAHVPYNFVVDNVLSVLGFADKDVPEGIYDWSISFGVSPEQADTHEAARDRVMSLLAQLRAAGWKRYIPVTLPRLKGKEAWQFGSSPKGRTIYSLDSTYTPTMEEWKSVLGSRPTWLFQADGVYLEVVVDESNMGGFVGKSTYLLGIKAESEYAFFGIGYFGGFGGDPERIDNWKALIPAELAKYHKYRLKTEAELRTAGYTIDTTYQDPPIKALQVTSDRTK